MLGKLLMAFAAMVLAAFVWASGIEPVATRAGEKTAFVETKIEKIGKHTYYPATLFDDRRIGEKDREYVLGQMRKGDANLTCDVYVNGFNSEYRKEGFHLFGYLLIDGVIEQDYSITSGNMEDGSVTWGSHRYGLLERIPKVTLAGREKVRPASEFAGAVYELALKNKNTIFHFRKEEAIRGSYLLMADAAGRLYYEFTINEYSTVRVDAITGEVLREFFWDGVYTEQAE
ncbi:MAG: hypothetical protein J5645_04575 [Lachnospiraceae bacterium]|nr:hypothetical protein [Lachnospiraceae bacterium]